MGLELWQRFRRLESLRFLQVATKPSISNDRAIIARYYFRDSMPNVQTLLTTKSVHAEDTQGGIDFNYCTQFSILIKLSVLRSRDCRLLT